jgi:hypothetical protein
VSRVAIMCSVTWTVDTSRRDMSSDLCIKSLTLRGCILGLSSVKSERKGVVHAGCTPGGVSGWDRLFEFVTFFAYRPPTLAALRAL